MIGIREMISVFTQREKNMHSMQRREDARRKIGVVGAIEGIVCVVALLTAGCAGDKGAAPSMQSPAGTLSTITASPFNAVVAVGDTFSVHVEGRAISGATISIFDSVRYVLNSIVDTARISVTPNGLVTARASSGNVPALLNVFAYKNGSAALDQVVIQVTSTGFTGATLSIQPVPPDSAKVARDNAQFISPVITNPATGETVPNVRLRLSSDTAGQKKIGCYAAQIPYSSNAFAFVSQSLLANSCAGGIGLNYFQAYAVGTAWVHAKAFVYGTMLDDSVLYTLTNSLSAYAGVSNVNLQISCGACYATIAPGGTVYFQNGLNPGLGMTVTFTFDNPEAALASDPPATVGDSIGNITTLQPYDITSRVFKTPGAYHWTETISGAQPPFENGSYHGTIVVE